MKRIKIHKICGTKIYIDIFYCCSSVVLDVVFAEYLLPYYYRNFSVKFYWLMSTLGVVTLFGIVYLQGMARVVGCHLAGAPLHSITLYLLGSIPENCGYSDNKKRNTVDFFSAAIGCMVSIIVSIGVFLLLTFAKKMKLPEEITTLFGYLFFTGAVLGLCNIFPLYPLDGGKLFKTILSLTSKDESWSHRLSCWFATVFSLLILYAGILMVLNGMITGGICTLVIGISSYRAVAKLEQKNLLSDQIKNIAITKVMKKIYYTVSENINLNQFMSEYVYRYNENVYPVTDSNGKIVNVITARQVLELPLNSQNLMTVADIESKEYSMPMIDQRCDVINAFSTMQQTGIKRFIVIDSLLSRKVLGVVTSEDIVVAFLKVMHGARI